MAKIKSILIWFYRGYNFGFIMFGDTNLACKAVDESEIVISQYRSSKIKNWTIQIYCNWLGQGDRKIKKFLRRCSKTTTSSHKLVSRPV